MKSLLFARIVCRLRMVLPNSLKFLVPEKIWIKALYRKIMNSELRLKNPITFNEKLNWMKLYDHNPLYVTMVDKWKAKEYVSKLLGTDSSIIPTIAVYESVNDIKWDELPEQFVVKCNHNSGVVLICRNKDEFDIENAKIKLSKCLEQDYSQRFGEWAYKKVPRRIIVEKYMYDESQPVLVDYKFYCFNGKPEFLYVSAGMEDYDTAKLVFLTKDWKQAPFHRPDHKEFETLPPKPGKYEEMLLIAEKLSAGFPFLRVDLYEINNQVYFSELTLMPCAGYMKFIPAKYDEEVGKLLHLQEKIR